MSDLEPYRSPVPPGWYSEPSSGTLRWWDGTKWGVVAPPATPQPVVAVPLAYKSTGTTYLLALLLGGLGIHNFYLGRTGVAAAQLIITLVAIFGAAAGAGAISWIVFIWVVVELFLIPGFVRDINARMYGSAMAQHQQL